MKNYKFLIKPLFFIFSLLFSSWLVVEIEKISPSDLGKYKSFFKERPEPRKDHKYEKQVLRKLVEDYKAGVIDSIKLDEQLEKISESSMEISTHH